MNFESVHEKTVLIVKPDGVQRGLIGEVLKRLEMKGMKIVGVKMMRLDEALLREHYAHHVKKPFYAGLEKFMRSSPVVVICAEGRQAVATVRLVAGMTDAGKADGGTIRGDLAMGMCNVVHCSDSVETAQAEVKRFFGKDDIFDYDKTEYLNVYMDEERG